MGVVYYYTQQYIKWIAQFRKLISINCVWEL